MVLPCSLTAIISANVGIFHRPFNRFDNQMFASLDPVQNQTIGSLALPIRVGVNPRVQSEVLARLALGVHRLSQARQPNPKSSKDFVPHPAFAKKRGAIPDVHNLKAPAEEFRRGQPTCVNANQFPILIHCCFPKFSTGFIF